MQDEKLKLIEEALMYIHQAQGAQEILIMTISEESEPVYVGRFLDHAEQTIKTLRAALIGGPNSN